MEKFTMALFHERLYLKDFFFGPEKKMHVSHRVLTCRECSGKESI